MQRLPHQCQSTTRGATFHSCTLRTRKEYSNGIQSRRPAAGRRQVVGTTGESDRLVRAASSHLVLHAQGAARAAWARRPARLATCRRRCHPTAMSKRAPPPPQGMLVLHTHIRQLWKGADRPRGAAPERPAGTRRCAAAASVCWAGWPGGAVVGQDAPRRRPCVVGGWAGAGLHRGGLGGDQSHLPLGGPLQSAPQVGAVFGAPAGRTGGGTSLLPVHHWRAPCIHRHLPSCLPLRLSVPPSPRLLRLIGRWDSPPPSSRPSAPTHPATMSDLRNRFGQLGMEALGAFMLVSTISISATTAPAAAPIAVGVILAAMIYAGGHVSGAHYNPGTGRERAGGFGAGGVTRAAPVRDTRRRRGRNFFLFIIWYHLRVLCGAVLLGGFRATVLAALTSLTCVFRVCFRLAAGYLGGLGCPLAFCVPAPALSVCCAFCHRPPPPPYG